MNWRGAAILAGLSLWVGAGAAPACAQRASFVRPPYAGAYEPQGVDERGLWMEVDEQERAVRTSPFVVRDPGLNDFVRGVLCRTVGDDRCRGVRIYIVKDSSFNASMTANGMMFVHTGLLARLHSEAELATVLGHEFAHFEQRHTLKRFRAMRGASDVMAWIVLAGAATSTSMIVSQQMIVIDYYRFNRGEEVESDLLAVQFIRASPYRLRASTIWQRTIAENDALRAERGMRKIRHARPNLDDTHPSELQRIGYFTQLEREIGDAGEDGVESYRAATSRALPLLFDSLIKGNNFAASDYVIRQRGEAMGWDGPLLYLRGELFRQRANPRDLVTARDLFQQAIGHGDAPAECWRGLGLASIRLGDAGTGKTALQEYLKRAPDAADAATVKMIMEN